MVYNHYRVKIDGRDCTAQVPFPIKFSQLLDEQLDEASISVIRTRRKNFKPLTPVTILLWNDEAPSEYVVLNMLVASDNAKELPVGSGKYNHELYLIEETKFLEGFLVRSHGYVNSLKFGIYAFQSVVPTVTRKIGTGEIPKPINQNVITPVRINIAVTIPSARDLFGTAAEVIYADPPAETRALATVIIYDANGNEIHRKITDEEFKYTFTDEGDYTLVYEFQDGTVYYNNQNGSTTLSTYEATYNFSAIEGPEKQYSPKWNALTVIRRAILVSEPILKGGKLRFTIEGDNPYFIGEFDSVEDLPSVPGVTQVGDIAWVVDKRYIYTDFGDGSYEWQADISNEYPLSGTALKLSKIETPEFQFTQSTLREILQGVGRYIHGEPRLKNGVIFYDFYGSNEKSEKVYGRYASQQLQLNIERFATGIDSTVDNLTNSLGYAQGVIMEPFSGGFKNVVTESLYMRIDETNAFADTQYPIRNLVKVMCYIDDGKSGRGHSASQAVDITSHIYESADYSRLSSYKVENAKAYALYYTTGEKGIRGLNARANVSILPEFERYAIINIMMEETGDNSFGGLIGPSDIARIKFQITYTPIISTRVQQSKVCTIGLDTPRNISYTQGQNLIESQYYGEHLKGFVARLGNIDKTITVVERGLALPPKIGTIYEEENGDYYVSAAAVEVNPTTTKVTISLSKDFNRYSDYVGINSMKRQYEISEKQAFASYFNYKDYCIIGDNITSNPNGLLFNIGSADGNLLPLVAKAFSQKEEVSDSSKYKDKPISFVKAKGFSDMEGNLNEIVLPVMVLPLGNSAVFSFKYEDNYSAGTSAFRKKVDDDFVYFANGTRYTDLFGNIDYLRLAYCSTVDLAHLAQNDKDLVSDTIMNQVSMTLPSANLTTDGVICGTINPDGTFNDKPIWIKKGSTEVPSITYQLDFVSNRKGIVIGSALAKNLPMVSGVQTGHYAVLYVLPKRLNKFDKTVDLSGAMRLRDYSNGSGLVINDYKTISFNNWSSSINGKAWALVDNATGELLIGENKEIKAGENVFGENGLHISFAHDIYKKGE